MTKKNKQEHEALVTKNAVEAVAAIVTEALNTTGVSADDLAYRLGVPVLYVKRLIAAEERPTVAMLAQVADALDLDLRMGFFKKESE